MYQTYTLLLPILFPILCGILAGLLPALKNEKASRIFVASSMFITLLLTLREIFLPDAGLRLFTLAPKMEIFFLTDAVTRFFACLIACMWLLSGVFSLEYLKHEENHSRYYSFFLLTEGAVLGVAFAGNLVTLYLCFEWMTLLTLPLVLHSQTEEAMKAGNKFLLYSFAGALGGVYGIPFLIRFGTTADFTPGGVLDMTLIQGHESLLLSAAFIVILGFGVKAGLFPLHAWLPTAHPAAPAPASAVLSGVITKTGIIAIVRVIFYQFGAAFLRGTWVQTALLYTALLTVFMGSSMALRETILKKRLAYSTVSQVSYILFGLFVMNSGAVTGALLHVLCHSVIKDGLFLCAGAIIYKTHKTDVEELRGIGKEMPIVLWCFTLFSLALIGIPPMCGFLSKWYLAAGSLSSRIPVISWLGPVILLISALLTAAYLLPVSVRGFFPGDDYDYTSLVRKEPNALMLIPLILLALLAAFTVFPGPFVALAESVTAALL